MTINLSDLGWTIFLAVSIKLYLKNFLSIKRVMNAFKRAGLEMENPKKMTAEDFQFAPAKPNKAVRVEIPSIGTNGVAQIIDFNDTKDVGTIKDYYDSLEKQSTVLCNWILTHKNILIKINKIMPQEQVLKYQEALEKL